MIESLILIEGNNIQEEDLKISLMNTKQVVIGSVIGFGVILHVAATSADDINNALLEFAKLLNVIGVVTLMHRVS